MLNRELAEKILDIWPIPQLQARIAELGQKHDEGVVTEDESNEYRSLVEFGDILSLLKSKARQFLEENPD